jgi:hypothetical protein
MPIISSRFVARALLVIAFVLSLASWQAKGVSAAHDPDSPQKADSSSYRSPYTVKYSYSANSLIGDIIKGARGNPETESTVPFHEWYARSAREKLGSWGPPARQYPPVPGVEKQPLEWRRERVIATALRFEGYGYQHHHIPDWQPPAGWAWKETAVGHNGKGVDCSNFSAFTYNLAYGVKPNSDVLKQSEESSFAGPGEGHTPAKRIALPSSYAEMKKTLQTGDLLYIKGSPGGHITHVVLWVGAIGQSPDGAPLILDSHGQGVKDASGVNIPAGIHLRPFHEHSWYHKCASHALRVLHD